MKKFQQSSFITERDTTGIDYTFIAEYDEVFGSSGEVLIEGNEGEFLFCPDKNQVYYWSKSQETWKALGWNK